MCVMMILEENSEYEAVAPAGNRVGECGAVQGEQQARQLRQNKSSLKVFKPLL